MFFFKFRVLSWTPRRKGATSPAFCPPALMFPGPVIGPNRLCGAYSLYTLAANNQRCTQVCNVKSKASLKSLGASLKSSLKSFGSSLKQSLKSLQASRKQVASPKNSDSSCDLRPESESVIRVPTPLESMFELSTTKHLRGHTSKLVKHRSTLKVRRNFFAERLNQ